MINFYKNLRFSPVMKFMLFVSLLCLVLFFKYIFGGFVYIFKDIGADTINLYYPSFYFNARLFQDSFSWYSFNLGLGSSTLFSNLFLFDPFSLFLYLLPKESISSGIVYTIILKILFVAYFSYKYFKELLPDSDEIVKWVGATAVTFSGFFILWGQHYFMSTAMAYFPLFLYGFELLLKYKRKKIFVISVALLAMYFYFFYQVAIFSAFYFTVRILTYNGLDTIKKKLLFIGKLLLPLFILGTALVSFKVIPNIIELIESPRINTEGIGLFRYLNFSSLEIIGNTYLRLFSNNFWGCGQQYFGFMNYYESPQIYSTLLILLLMPQAFLIKDKRLIVLVVSLALFILFLFVSPFLSVLFNGVQYPSYRWGMLASMSMVIIGIIGLFSLTSSFTKQNIILLIFTPLIYLAFILIVVLQLRESNFTIQIIKVVVLFSIYVAAFLLLRNKIRLLYPIILAILFFDVFFEHNPTINKRPVLKNNFEESGKLFFDSSADALNSIYQKDTTFFRVIRDSYSVFLDDSQIQGYNGLTCYNSLNDPFYIRFLKKTGVPFFLDNNVSYIGQYGGRPILYDLLSVKYNLRNGLTGDDKLVYSDSKRHKYCYLRKNSLPLGFTYDSYILENNIENYRDEMLLKAVVLDERPTIKLTGFEKFNGITPQPLAAEKQEVDISVFEKLNVKQDSANSFEGKSNDPMFVLKVLRYPTAEKILIDFDLYAEKTCISQLFYSYETDRFSEALSESKVVKEGNNHLIFELAPDFYSQSGIKEIRIDPINYAGNFKIENVVITYYKAAETFFDSRVNQMANVPDKRDERTELYLLLKRDTLTITHFTPDHINGTISVDENKILFLSIPFNEGWKIRLNGKKVEPILANYGFMGFPLEKGSYFVELIFFPYGLKTGLLISFFTVLLTLIYTFRNCSFFKSIAAKTKS